MSETAAAIYEHTDLVLETCLCLRNDPNMRSEAARRDHKVVWTYQKTPELEAFLQDFYAGRHTVEPIAFSKMLRSVRTAVYSLMDYDPPRLAQTPSSDKSAA